MTIDLIVHGAAGRMGRRLIALAHESENFNLIGAIESPEHPQLGQDAGVVAGTEPLALPIVSSIEKIEKGDVIIDFSGPQAFSDLLKVAKKRKLPLLSGTTGLSEDQKQAIERAGEEIPILHSPNMSIGVNLLFMLAAEMARLGGDAYEVEIVEAHHHHKKDAPSGTALRLGEVIAEAKGWNFKEVMRQDRQGKRQQREIGIQSLRAGDIVGEHTAYFVGEGERIELTHRATSRDIFVRGALKAALWLASQPRGHYTMKDFLSAI